MYNIQTGFDTAYERLNISYNDRDRLKKRGKGKEGYAIIIITRLQKRKLVPQHILVLCEQNTLRARARVICLQIIILSRWCVCTIQLAKASLLPIGMNYMWIRDNRRGAAGYTIDDP